MEDKQTKDKQVLANVDEEVSKKFGVKVAKEQTTKSKVMNKMVENYMKKPFPIKTNKHTIKKPHGFHLTLDNWKNITKVVAEQVVDDNIITKSDFIEAMMKEYLKE